MKHDITFNYINLAGGKDRLVPLMENRWFTMHSSMLDKVNGDWRFVYTEPFTDLADSCGNIDKLPERYEFVSIGINFLYEDCPMEKNTYVLYKGDEVLAVGTMQDIANKLGVKRDTIKFYSMPAYRRKCRGNNITYNK